MTDPWPRLRLAWLALRGEPLCHADDRDEVRITKLDSRLWAMCARGKLLIALTSGDEDWRRRRMREALDYLDKIKDDLR